MKRLTLSAIAAAIICTAGAAYAAPDPTIFNTRITNTTNSPTQVTGAYFTIYYPPFSFHKTYMMLTPGRNVDQYTTLKKVPPGAFAVVTALRVKGGNIPLPTNLQHKIYNNCSLVIGSKPKGGKFYQFIYQGGPGASHCYYSPPLP